MARIDLHICAGAWKGGLEKNNLTAAKLRPAPALVDAGPGRVRFPRARLSAQSAVNARASKGGPRPPSGKGRLA